MTITGVTGFAHTHPCVDCQTPVDCDGDLERNHDGFPDVICRSYHLTGGFTAALRCDACTEARERSATYLTWTARKSYTGGA